jgi:hypothetical protein
MKIDGACHCGDITFNAEIDPAQVLICHCTDCQTLSGSAYRTVVPVTGDSFNLLSGTLKTYIKTAADGTRRSQTFCPAAVPRFTPDPLLVRQVCLGYVWGR